MTWTKNTLSYLSTVEGKSSLLTSSSKSRRTKANTYPFCGARKYDQLCKFRKNKKRNKAISTFFESASLCTRYILGWYLCDQDIALYTIQSQYACLTNIGKTSAGKHCLIVLVSWPFPRQWSHRVSHSM